MNFTYLIFGYIVHVNGSKLKRSKRVSYITKSSLPTLSPSHLFLQHNQRIQFFHTLLPETLSAHMRKYLYKYSTWKKDKAKCKKNY